MIAPVVLTPPPPAAAPDFPPLLLALEAALARQPSRASVNPGVGRFLHGLVRLLAPQLIIETGTYIGYSSLMLASALRANGHGHLHSFDLFVNPLSAHPFAADFPAADLLDLVRRHAAAAGLADNVTYHAGDSSQKISALLAENPNPVDLAFIDGDHRAQGCLRDWNAIAPRLRELGLVILHDTCPQHSGWLGPRRLIEQLQADPAAWSILDLPTADTLGLAILQKRAPVNPLTWRPSLLDLARQLLLHRIHGWKQPRP